MNTNVLQIIVRRPTNDVLKILSTFILCFIVYLIGKPYPALLHVLYGTCEAMVVELGL